MHGRSAMKQDGPYGSFFRARSLVYRARVALSTASTITPTSAKMAVHMLAMRIARRTLRIVYQNIVFALAIKFACLVLGALGLASMWTAIFADVGVMVLAVLNATRALYTKDLAKKNVQ